MVTQNALLTGEPVYGKALDRIWGNITNTRMHITGGLGAVHGIEGFGPQYELPNADAFNETCAAVGNVLFNYRMFLLHKDAKYLDVAEVALLNNVLAAVNLEGNRIAFTRGPFVLCAEGVDNGGATQRFFFDKLPDTSEATIKTTRIETGSFIQAKISAQAVTKSGDTDATTLVLTPYYAWNNRGTSSMTVWFPRDKSLAVFDPHSLPKESIFKEITASHTADEDTVSAIGDGRVDKWSSGNKVPRWTSRGQPGKAQWVTGRFRETKSIRSVGVFWMNRWQGDVRLPKEWSLEVEQDGKWKPFELYTTDRYDTRANQYNVVHPAAPLKCDAIRIRMAPRADTSVGILEVQVAFEE